MRVEPVKVCGVGDLADEASGALAAVIEGEVVEQRTQEPGARPSPDHDLVGRSVGHVCII